MNTRRRFLSDVGQGMFVASIGPALALEMGLGTEALAESTPGTLTFGTIEPLVDLMHSTSPDALMPIVVEKLRAGVPIEQLVSAAALANARAFGGEDYVGFHTMMALAPAYQMARELPDDRRALPVMKVLYRNSNRLREQGGADTHTLQVVQASEAQAGVSGDVALRDAVRAKDMARAEQIYSRLAKGSPDDALNQLLLTVQDATEVHRVVLVWRAWSLLDLVGKEQAHTMLRQSVHYCVKNESPGYAQSHGAVRNVLPRLFDQYHLLGKPAGSKPLDDERLERLSREIFTATADQAAEIVAASLAEGISPSAIAEAISLAANQLVLRDTGRLGQMVQPNKPAGSVHGDSVGVHGCDAVNAWCNIAAVSNARNAAAGLMLAAYEVARDRLVFGRNLADQQPWPLADDAARIRAESPEELLAETESAILGNDQPRAAAAVARYGQLGHSPRPVLDLMLRYAVSEDGALHAEKYYRTVSEEFARTRPAFRWRQLVALARVTASAHGYAAPGYAQSCELLGVKA